MSSPTLPDAIRLMGRAAYYWRVYCANGYYHEQALGAWAVLSARAERALHGAIIGTDKLWSRDADRLSPAAIMRRAEAMARQAEVGAWIAETARWRSGVPAETSTLSHDAELEEVAA